MIISGSGRNARRRITFFIADSLCIAAAVMLAVLVYHFGIGAGWRGVSRYVGTHELAMLVWGVVFIASLYTGGCHERIEPRYGAVLRLLSGCALAAMVLHSLLAYAVVALKLGRLVFVMATLFGIWLCSFWRFFYATSIGRRIFERRTLIIGAETEAAKAMATIESAPDSGYAVIGLVDFEPHRVGMFIGDLPVVGNLDSLEELVDRHEVDTLIVAAPREHEHKLLVQLRPFRYRGIEIVDFISLSEELEHLIPLDYINDEWLMMACLNNSHLHIRRLKRLLDVSVAVVGLVLSSPVALVAAGLIRLSSRGPALFRQERVGMEGRRFILYKFRTMRANAEEDGNAIWAEENDPRITALGRFLRKTRIDEIPQLINVLKGEMSLVGPRPERPQFVEQLDKVIPFYSERLHVRPGITGWAQVRYYYAGSVEESRIKLQYDLYYIKHMSFALDCMILLQTLRIIMLGRVHRPKRKPTGFPTPPPSREPEPMMAGHSS
jgi:exopolysaccharide biosynthesis polyprenyl glycosylphosphotransferase